MENLINTLITDDTEEIEAGKGSKVKVPKFRLKNFLTNLVEDTKAMKPSDKEKKIAEADTLIEEGEHLSTMYETYKDEFIVRGNKALYDLLASMYAYALRINESPRKEMILERMVAVLKEKFDIKTTKNTPWLTTIVKFIVKTGRQTASNYSRVLQVAFDENLAVKDVSAYIERRGGIADIRETEAKAAAKEGGDSISKQRTQLMREILVANAHKCESIKYDGEFIQWSSKKGGDATKEKSESEPTFAHFIGYEGMTDEYYIVAANDFGKNFEDVILRKMSSALPEDMVKLRASVKRMQTEKAKWIENERVESPVQKVLKAQKVLENKKTKPE